MLLSVLHVHNWWDQNKRTWTTTTDWMTHIHSSSKDLYECLPDGLLSARYIRIFHPDRFETMSHGQSSMLFITNSRPPKEQYYISWLPRIWAKTRAEAAIVIQGVWVGSGATSVCLLFEGQSLPFDRMIKFFAKPPRMLGAGIKQRRQIECLLKGDGQTEGKGGKFLLTQSWWRRTQNELSNLPVSL